MLWPYLRDHRNESASRYKLPPLSRRTGATKSSSRFTDEIAADCPRKQRLSDYDPCTAQCPDLPKVL
jgi:hypothetical protein